LNYKKAGYEENRYYFQPRLWWRIIIFKHFSPNIILFNRCLQLPITCLFIHKIFIKTCKDIISLRKPRVFLPAKMKYTKVNILRDQRNIRISGRGSVQCQSQLLPTVPGILIRAESSRRRISCSWKITQGASEFISSSIIA